MTFYTLTTYGPREWLCRIGLLPGTLHYIRKRILVADVQRAVAKHYGMHISVMKAENKGVRTVWLARQAAMYLSSTCAQASAQHIGRLFHRDHSTVIHAIRQVSARMETDADLANDLRTIERELRA